MRIADGVEMLEISAEGLAGPTKIYPALVWDNENVVLIDTGYPGQLAKFQAAFQEAGVPFDRLNKIILTHHDLDHIGGLKEIKNAVSHKVTALSHVDEKDYIAGIKRPLKLAQMEANLDSLPEDRKAFYQRFKAGFEKSKAPIDQTLTDGEVLPDCGGIEVIFTPGHTLGHMSLYLKPSKTLISGDALRVENGNLSRTPPSINYDMDLYNSSLKKLANYDIDAVICYHGGVFRENPNQRIAALAREQA